MKLSEWLGIERGRGLSLASAIGVPPTLISQWSTTRVPPFERCIPIERATDGQVTRRDLRPDDWQEMWPELAQAQADHAPAATELIAVAMAAIDAVLHRAEDRIDELKKDAQVELKLTSVEVRGEIEKDAHDTIERLAAPKPWSGIDRRADAAAPASAAPRDGQERRKTHRRRLDGKKTPISLDAN